MANTTNVGIIDTANTFNHWRIRDNLIANDVNEIVRGDFTKPSGNIIIEGSGTGQGRLVINNSTGGITFQVKDDARIDNLLSVDTIESDDDGHVYLAAGDITMGNRAAGGLFQANINTNFNSAYVAFSNDTVGLINVNTRTLIVNTANALFQNNNPGATLNVNVYSTTFYGTNVAVDNTSSGTLIVTNRLTHVNSGNIYFGNTDVEATFNVLTQNTNFLGPNVNFDNTSVGTINVDNRIVQINTPNVILTNTSATATFNVFPNTFFHGGSVNVANTTEQAIVHITPNTTFFTNVTVQGTEDVISDFRVNTNKFTVTASSGDTVVAGDLTVQGGDIISSTAEMNLVNSTATTVNFANAATTLRMGAAAGTIFVGGDLQVEGNDIKSSTGAAALSLSATDVTVAGDLTVSGGDIISTATANLVNTSVTAVNLGGAAATVRIGSTTGNTVARNDLIIDGNTSIGTDLSVSGKLGLGTATPNSTLTVLGNVWITNGGNVTGTLNVTSANIISAAIESLTLVNPIQGQTELGTNSFRLRVGQTTRETGQIGVFLGSAANGNAWIAFDTAPTGGANVWRVTANSTEGTYYTLITMQNVVATTSNTSTIYVAAANTVNTLNTLMGTTFTTLNTSAATQNTWINNLNTATSTINSHLGTINTTFSTVNTTFGTVNTTFGTVNTTFGTLNTNITNITTGATPTTLRGYNEGVNTATVTGGTFVCNLTGNNVFDLTLQSSTTTITFTNAATSGFSKPATLILRQPSSSANTVTFANTINWSDNEVPVLSSGIAKKLDIITVMSLNGAIFFGSHVMANVSYP
jgi:hypothetical protein